MLRAVAETGSFTGAGRKLHVSQSAVSRQILMLEDELKESLFTRAGRKIRITASGDVLLQLSRRVFADIQETCDTIREKQRTLTGTLQLVGGMTVCMYVFPALLKEFRRLHPGMEVTVTTGTTARLIRRLASGAVDLGLLTLPVDNPNLVAVPVMREELLLVTSPSHPLAREKRITPQHLVGQPFVLFEHRSNTRRVLDEFFLREHIAPRIVTETENVEIIKAMVRVGLGISIIPYQAVAREVQAGYLSCARITGEELMRETGWVYLRTNRVPRAVEELINVFKRTLPRLKLAPRPAARASR
jgi:DNA-binding transcriptional LysR family regulator